MKPTRAEFLRQALSLMGTAYIYGGRSSHGLDCSGLVAFALLQAGSMTGPEPVDLRSWWTDRMWLELPEVDVPLPGDLALYGGRGSDVSHVMVVLHAPSPALPEGMVFGASGGTSSTTTLAEAMRRGACVKPKTAIRYRHPDDFRGFRSLSPYLSQEMP